jgi:2-hydroxychromene-2-carboxylate isomerase
VKADWYFDFISPFAYLQTARLPELEPHVELTLKPVLFAALLDHWGQLGPAEIAPKRSFIYAQTGWLARRYRIAFKSPRAHPFNPLRLLRLAIHLGPTPATVKRLFEFVWAEGQIPEDESAWRHLVQELGVENADAAITRPEVKAQLRKNTEEAIAAGVFGVPTIAIGGKIFWGFDSTQMLLDYLSDPEPFRRDDARIAVLPIGAERPGARR